MTDKPEYIAKVREALRLFGDLYNLEDVLVAIDTGEMQSFVHKASGTWVITKVDQYPNKRVLNVVLGVGTAEGILALQKEVVQFGKDHECDLMWSVSRKGWERFMTPGWTKTASIYIRELK